MAKKWHFFLFILLLISVVGLFAPVSGGNADNSAIVPADIAWILTASAMVFFMTPGLAFFMVEWLIKRILFQPCCQVLSL